MFITKSSGEKVLFEKEKITRTALRAGAQPNLAEAVAQEVTRRVVDGTTTKQIFEMILEILDRDAPPIAARYNLVQALFQLGPTGFEFEKYVAALLHAYGYETELPEILSGACITHEVDVLAVKDNRRAMIECKFRHEANIYIGIKDVMANWARYLDLVDGAKRGLCPQMDECWLITNTRFSSDALKFAACKNITLIGWNYPEERSISHMIDAKAVYPVTVLRDADAPTLKALAHGKIMLLKQLTEGDTATLAQKTGLTEERIKLLTHEASQIINLP